MAVYQAQKFAQNTRNTDAVGSTYKKVEVTLNMLAWLLMLLGLIAFHYARPDVVYGVQEFWGVDVRTNWSAQHMGTLMMLLKSALVTSLLTLLMRSRRKARGYAVNLFILAGIAIASLVSLSTVVVA